MRPIAVLLLASLLGGCGDSLPPPAKVPPLPPPAPHPSPLANRPGTEEELPQEGAARALKGFLAALAAGEWAAAATFLDPVGPGGVPELRRRLERGEGGGEARAWLGSATPGEAEEIGEIRARIPLGAGPGGRRPLQAFLRRDGHGWWLVERIAAVPAR